MPAALRTSHAARCDLGGADVVFSCLPHGESGEWAQRAAAAGALAIDLSADLREAESGAVYGLPELWRSEVKDARLVANPGCYPTGILLGLTPAVARGPDRLARSAIVIDAASGVTGAGRTAKRDLLFGEVAEDYRAYGVGNQHRHVPEMRAGLGRLNGGAPQFIFTPHLLPVRRGNSGDDVRAADAGADHVRKQRRAVAGDLRDEPFVDVAGAEGCRRCATWSAATSCAIGFSDVESAGAPMLIVVAALDNLVKGAAGQALQNANLMLGFEETLGLPP